MNDKELVFDRECHVLYSKECKKEILEKIARHYPKDEIEDVFTSVQKQYVAYLENFRTDLGGKANFHNGVAGTYDDIALFSYYKVCKDKTSFREIEEMHGNLFLPTFQKLKYVNCNNPVFRRILHMVFMSSKKKCDKWKDFEMHVAPYQKNEPIRYTFTACPVAEFARENDLLDILPAFCNVDYAAMEMIHAKLIRTTTCGNGDICDYAICGDKDPYAKLHEEYVDDAGYRRNR